MKGLAHLWRNHRLAVVGFALALLLTLLFAARLIAFAVYWSDPAHRAQRPEGWMTTGYVARSWQVPRADLARALALEPRPGRPPTLAEIAAERGQPLGAVIAEVEAALAAIRAGQGGQ